MPNTCKSNDLWQFIVKGSGRRVSNTWAICLGEGDNLGKPGLIPRETKVRHRTEAKVPQGTLREEPMPYQLVGEVTAHQGYDG